MWRKQQWRNRDFGILKNRAFFFFFFTGRVIYNYVYCGRLLLLSLCADFFSYIQYVMTFSLKFIQELYFLGKGGPAGKGTPPHEQF